MSRVWIYQSNRFFSSEEKNTLNVMSDKFVSEWNAHGKKLNAQVSILHNLFIIIQVDEEQVQASGCSIDKSVQFVHTIENKLDVQLFDRFGVAYFDESGDLKLANKQEFAELVSQGNIQDETIVFNNSITTSDELKTKWKIPFRESWHARIFTLPQ